jgi:hypothetical protein
MSKSSFLSLFSVAAFSLGLVLPAGATTVTVSSTIIPAGYSLSSFGPTLATSTNGGGVWSGTTNGSFSAGVSNKSVANSYTDPMLADGDYSGRTQNYAYAEAGTSVNVSYATGLSSFAMLWGSPDTTDSLVLHLSDGTSTTYVPGSGALSGLGTCRLNSCEEYVQFSEGPGVKISSITFSASVNSFEFETEIPTTVPTTTPEPASIALLGGGLLAVGAGAMRRRKSA